MKPLGEIFDGSVLDGFAALQKAEEQRRFKSSNSIMDGVYANSKLRTIKSSDKDEEHYQTSKKIETINVNKGLFATENNNEGDGKRAFLQDVQTLQLENKTSSLVYMSNDQIKLREKINLLQQEGYQFTIDKMSSKQEEIYSLKELIDENSNRVFESTTTEANENVKDDKTIQGFVTVNDQFIFEKETEKRKDDQTMQDISIAAADYKNKINNQNQIKYEDEYQLLQSKQESIKSATLKVEQKDNNEAIETAKNVSKSIQEKDKKDSQKMNAKTELYDKIKSKQSDLASEKNEKTQNKSDEITNTNVSLVDQKTKQQLEVNANTSQQDKKTENLKSMMNAHHAASSDKSQKNNDKHYSNQVSINTAEHTKTPKTISPNELGKTYDEGVTEESFAQKDDKGLMKAFITRRVVVIEGRGIVYVRTQTVQATTFTKDGVSITESTWQKETQDPKLTKHKKN